MHFNIMWDFRFPRRYLYFQLLGEEDCEEREKWVVVRDNTGGGEQNLSSVLKVPRHCPFVLLVSVNFNRYY
jgi:hypothetical protein